MAKRHTLHLSDEQLAELRHLRDTGEPAYLRERAAALLKIATGTSPHKVAQSGLLKNGNLTPSIPGFNTTVKQELWGCDINPVKAENRFSHPCQKKMQNRNSKALSIETRRCCLHKRHAGRLASSVPLCLGSTICQYRVRSAGLFGFKNNRLIGFTVSLYCRSKSTQHALLGCCGLSGRNPI